MATENQRSSDDIRADATPEPNLRIIVPDELRLHISLEGVPESVSALFQKLGKPASESKLKGIIKDYLPALTPVATALFTGLVAFYGIKFNDQLTRDTLDKITSEFVEKKGDPNIAAMKLAAYGDKALPAVWIALGAEDPQLRNGAVKIAEQMSYEGAIDPRTLSEAMLKHYKNNPVLRLGVLEWLSGMESENRLSEAEAKDAFRHVQETFGLGGERCADQEEDLAEAAADFLAAGSLAGTNDFVRGMDAHCPKDYTGVHKTLQDMAGSR